MKYIGFCASESIKEMNKDFVNELSYIVDNDKNKYGSTLCGIKICTPDKLMEEDKDNIRIFVLLTGWYPSVSLQLKGMGLAEGIHFSRAIDWFGDESLPNAYASRTWDDRESETDFDNYIWDTRKKLMASLIDFNNCHSIMDLGCGNMGLKKYLPDNITYYPVDYIKRDKHTFISDFNKYEFPDIKADYAFISGCLEYVKDWQWFLKTVASNTDNIVLSYNYENNGIPEYKRRMKAWQNSISAAELIVFMQQLGFILVNSSCAGKYTILVFNKRGCQP